MNTKENLINKSVLAHQSFVDSISNEELDLLMSEFDALESESNLNDTLIFGLGIDSSWLDMFNSKSHSNKPPNIVIPNRDMLQKEPSTGSFLF
ncbi:hypothetical protein [uncultured Dokdonia sp.]|uniref:hypothetical protein n=1 Tax=uncultured Dokdonia sp. TaxID=575653 RepID=UPI00261956A5|nr:hypothetical protein [uncultured Dokdonia sp.]